MEYYIGIDVGTSSAKLLLMDENGVVLNQQDEEYQISQPQSGWKEINPELWFQAVKRAMKRLLYDIETSLVKGIGITGQMHTTVFVDKNGKSIRPAIMWNDTRTKKYIPFLKEQISKCSDVSHISNIISTGSPASNLLWLKQNEPENFKKIKKFLIGPDYIVYRFSGVFGTDYCEASTSSLFDLLKREWAPTMQKIIGLPVEIFPQVRGSGEFVGYLNKEIAKEFKLSTSVKMIAGTGDNTAASISTGCLGNKYPILSLGTSGVLVMRKDSINFDAKGKNILFSIDNKKFYTLVQGVVQSAGGSYSWFVKNILESTDFDKECGETEFSKLGESDVLFFPHLVGDKTLYSDSTIRGAFLGLGTDVTRNNMIISVMEGICFGVRELAEKMNVTKESLFNLKVTGGGAKNLIWMQILADVLNTKVQQLEGNVGAAYGMALLAALRCGKFSSLEEMSEKSVKVKKCFIPREYNVQLYKKKYEKYKKVYTAVKTIFE